jgi:hypothetical protein
VRVCSDAAGDLQNASLTVSASFVYASPSSGLVVLQYLRRLLATSAMSCSASCTLVIEALYDASIL